MDSGVLDGGYLAGVVSSGSVEGLVSSASIDGEMTASRVEGRIFAASVSGTLSIASLTGEVVSGGDAVMPPTYLGPYEADARFDDQTFATGMRYMAKDFTVNAINYTEAPNDSGITVTIGG